MLPAAEHGHLQCRACGGTWELDPTDAAAVVAPIRSRFGFAPDVGHLTISGLCSACASSSPAAGEG